MNYLGIDIGGTNLKAGIVSDEGKILRQKSVRTPTNLDDFSKALNNLVRELSESDFSFKSVGIGCKGIIDPVTTEVQICPGEFSFLERHRLNELLQPSIGKEVAVVGDNDARAALVGERVWGIAREVNNVLMLTLGTGIGGAILADGKIIRGKSGVAGHLGHITVEPLGKECFCGNRGCLETLFSARAIESAAIDYIIRGCETTLSSKFKNDLNALTCADVFDSAKNGDAVSKRVIDDSINILSAVIAGLLFVFDPEILIISGKITEAGDILFKPLSEQIYLLTKRWIPNQPVIAKPILGDSTGIVGAAALTQIQ